ncbi:rhoGEF domain-containing protein gxcJ-like [Metopolophium dirhodum]|uniref:rhoGEF domain-containing protein gxcJ-like n=1 Tax=Metopolophium dirhodum TaxID=44670 RepID=UPI00299003D2|nr:rhoGEF domain-containing protein gxcJ-like [Metopolophium dirhodum]
MSEDILEVIDSRLMKPYKYPRIVYKGYLFHYHKSCNHHIRWKCNRVYSMNCQAVLRTSLDVERPKLIQFDHEHQHEDDTDSIFELKMKIMAHRNTSKFQNNTMFKSKNGLIELKIAVEDIPANFKMLKPKNGYADINVDEEDKPNKLVTFCASYDQHFFVQPLDPDYEHRYTGEREQIIKNKNINKSVDIESPKIRITRNTSKQKKDSGPDYEHTYTGEHEQIIKNKNINKSVDIESPKIRITRNTSKQKKDSGPDYEHRYTGEHEQIIKNKNINKSVDIESPKIRITRNTSKQKKIDMNNLENDITENSIRCSSFNDKIKKFNKGHEKKLRKKQNLIVSKKKKNHEQMNECTLLTKTDTEKNASNTNTDKKINNKTINTSDEKKSLICIINKNNNTLTCSNTYEEINLSTSITHKKTNTLTTNILTSNEHNKINMLTTNNKTSKEKNAFLSNKNKDESTFTGTNTPTIVTSKINITPSIKSCMNKRIGVEDDIRNIDNDSDQNHTDHRDGEPNYVNSVKDNTISIYCKENWPTILDKLSDPLKGIKVFESILFNKACTLMMRQSTKNKLHIDKIKGLNVNWKLKFECLAFKMKKIIESTKCYTNTRHTGIQNQNKMDITLSINIGVGEKENNSGVNKIDIKTTKHKEIQTNIPSTPVIADLIKNIPLSTTVSILSPKSVKINKRNLTESDPCITRTKAKIKKTQHSSIPNFDHMNVHIPPDTTALRISPKSFYTKQNNLTQFDSGIKMTQSKTIESNEQSTLVSTNVCRNPQNSTQYDQEIEISVNYPQAITTSGLCNYSLSNQKTISTQHNTDIKKTKSKIMESTPAYIDLTVNSPPDMRNSSVSPNMLNGQSSLTQCNTQLECNEPSTSASIDLPVNNIFTQYNNGIKVISSPSMSTDLSSNSPTFSSPSLRAIIPNGNPALLGQQNVEVLVVQKDSQLSTMKSNRIKQAHWKSPKNLTMFTQSTMLHENACLPVAVKRALKPKLSPQSSNVQKAAYKTD